MPKKGEPKQFEDALQKLEQIVAELEGDDLSLDASIAKYEEGMKLSVQCQKRLEEAQQKIVKVQEAANGQLKETPLEDDGDEGGLFDAADKEKDDIPF